MTIIICNLKENLITNLQISLGSKVTDCRALLRQFFKIQEKKIIKNPRRVHISNELKQHQLYKCEKKQVISTIIKKIENGEDLNIYLSDKQDEYNSPDWSLTFMGFHHLHLGETIEKNGKMKGLIKRTKSLLFIMIEDQDAYLTDILSHDMIKGFLNRELLHIIYKNWSHLLEPYLISRGDIECTEILDNDFSRVIQHNISVPYSPEDGIAYFLPRNPSNNEMKINKFFDALEEIENLIKNRLSIAEEIRQETGIKYNVLRFSIEINDNGEFLIKNNNSGIVFYTLLPQYL